MNMMIMPRMIITILLLCYMGNSAYSIGLHSDNQEVIVEISGWIKRKCSLKNVPHLVNLGNLTKKSSHRIEFTINCNAPFQYGISSKGGALVNLPTWKSSKSKKKIELPYHLKINILTDEGIIVDECASDTLPRVIGGAGTCLFSDSGKGVAINKAMSLNFSWNLDHKNNIAAGKYRDQLSIWVGLKP